jgi:hypothetical protein
VSFNETARSVPTTRKLASANSMSSSAASKACAAIFFALAMTSSADIVAALPPSTAVP